MNTAKIQKSREEKVLSIIFDLELIKTIFLYVIFFVSVFYQLVLMISMFLHRKDINFLDTIKRDGRISKSGIFFFVLMSVIIYQALFLGDVTAGLIELMVIIVAGDVGTNWVNNKKHVDLERIRQSSKMEKVKKTNDVEMSSDDFKDL